MSSLLYTLCEGALNHSLNGTSHSLNYGMHYCIMSHSYNFFFLLLLVVYFDQLLGAAHT